MSVAAWPPPAAARISQTSSTAATWNSASQAMTGRGVPATADDVTLASKACRASAESDTGSAGPPGGRAATAVPAGRERPTAPSPPRPRPAPARRRRRGPSPVARRRAATAPAAEEHEHDRQGVSRSRRPPTTRWPASARAGGRASGWLAGEEAERVRLPRASAARMADSAEVTGMPSACSAREQRAQARARIAMQASPSDDDDQPRADAAEAVGDAAPPTWRTLMTSRATPAPGTIRLRGEARRRAGASGSVTKPPHTNLRRVLPKRRKARAKRAFRLRSGRGDWIRTSDLSVPNRALYQAEPRPEAAKPECSTPRPETLILAP